MKCQATVDKANNYGSKVYSGIMDPKDFEKTKEYGQRAKDNYYKKEKVMTCQTSSKEASAGESEWILSLLYRYYIIFSKKVNPKKSKRIKMNDINIIKRIERVKKNYQE